MVFVDMSLRVHIGANENMLMTLGDCMRVFSAYGDVG